MKRFLPLLLLAGCNGASGTQVTVQNERSVATTVYVAFGAGSKVNAASWSFCSGSGLTCSFDLTPKNTAGSARLLPNASADYLNATFSFDAAVGCGVTKAEVDVNNPSWYDTLDVSLVDGYSDNVQIYAAPSGGGPATLGPPVGATGNEKVYGVFPVGCDICVERQNPPCGIAKGKTGCKTGTQYDPDVPCQWQGPVKGGGGTVTISLMP